MVCLEPHSRISAKAALQHPYFDDLDKSQFNYWSMYIDWSMYIFMRGRSWIHIWKWIKIISHLKYYLKNNFNISSLLIANLKNLTSIECRSFIYNI